MHTPWSNQGFVKDSVLFFISDQVSEHFVHAGHFGRALLAQQFIRLLARQCPRLRARPPACCTRAHPPVCPSTACSKRAPPPVASVTARAAAANSVNVTFTSLLCALHAAYSLDVGLDIPGGGA